jgi:hypothetical protein
MEDDHIGPIEGLNFMSLNMTDRQLEIIQQAIVSAGDTPEVSLAAICQRYLESDGPACAETPAPTDSEKEQLIDAFLAGWGGLKETREIARLYLEGAYWDVSMAQQRYWHEVILTHEYAL